NVATVLVQVLERNLSSACTNAILRALRRLSMLESCSNAVSLIVEDFHKKDDDIFSVVSIETFIIIAESDSSLIPVFLGCGFIDSAVILLTNEDVILSRELVEARSSEDFDLKRLLLRFSQSFLSNTQALNKLVDMGLIENLLKYLDVSQFAKTSSHNLSLFQLASLHHQILGFLCQILPSIPYQWQSLNGSSIALDFLKYARDADKVLEKNYLLFGIHKGLTIE
ncbi:hypothetical protein HDU67_001519, partial [Dinochytrium kinnereticum]